MHDHYCKESLFGIHSNGAVTVVVVSLTTNQLYLVNVVYERALRALAQKNSPKGLIVSCTFLAKGFSLFGLSDVFMPNILLYSRIPLQSSFPHCTAARLVSFISTLFI